MRARQPRPVSLLGIEARRHWGQDGGTAVAVRVSRGARSQLSAWVRSERTCVSTILLVSESPHHTYIYTRSIHTYSHIYAIYTRSPSSSSRSATTRTYRIAVIRERGVQVHLPARGRKGGREHSSRRISQWQPVIFSFREVPRLSRVPRTDAHGTVRFFVASAGGVPRRVKFPEIRVTGTTVMS